MAEKSEFSKKFHKLSGLTYDVDALIEATPAEDKEALYAKISWEVWRGIIASNEPRKSEIEAFLSEAASKLGVSEASIVTEAPTTAAPTTEAPTTAVPEDDDSSDDSSDQDDPTTVAPTEAPATEAPATEAPTTVAPDDSDDSEDGSN